MSTAKFTAAYSQAAADLMADICNDAPDAFERFRARAQTAHAAYLSVPTEAIECDLCGEITDEPLVRRDDGQRACRACRGGK